MSDNIARTIPMISAVPNFLFEFPFKLEVGVGEGEMVSALKLLVLRDVPMLVETAESVTV